MLLTPYNPNVRPASISPNNAFNPTNPNPSLKTTILPEMRLPQFLHSSIHAIRLSIWAHSGLLIVLGVTALLGVFIVLIISLWPHKDGHGLADGYASAVGGMVRSLPTMVPEGGASGVGTMGGNVGRRL